MKTGVELIAKERQEQIEKHGFDKSHDANNRNCELVFAAMFMLTEDKDYWPKNWDMGWYFKFKEKSYQEKLVIAGALIAAEIDRLNSSPS